MSWYVSYYIGYRTKDGKIYPLVPFDSFGKLKSILTRSRSFASDLWDDFRSVSLKDTTDELRKYEKRAGIYVRLVVILEK